MRHFLSSFMDSVQNRSMVLFTVGHLDQPSTCLRIPMSKPEQLSRISELWLLADEALDQVQRSDGEL